jgi:hypothetical protein
MLITLATVACTVKLITMEIDSAMLKFNLRLLTVAHFQPCLIFSCIARSLNSHQEPTLTQGACPNLVAYPYPNTSPFPYVCTLTEVAYFLNCRGPTLTQGAYHCPWSQPLPSENMFALGALRFLP